MGISLAKEDSERAATPLPLLLPLLPMTPLSCGAPLWTKAGEKEDRANGGEGKELENDPPSSDSGGDAGLCQADPLPSLNNPCDPMEPAFAIAPACC